MDILISIGPIIIIALIGYFLKLIKLVKREFGDYLLYLVFYVSLPALIFNSFSSIYLDTKFALLPVITVILISSMYLLSYFTGKLLKLPKQTFGPFIIGTMILNNGFMLPFILAAYGDEGVARLLIFDFMNGFLAFTWVYYIACKNGSKPYDKSLMIKKFLLSPPIWAIVLSIPLNLLNVEIPLVITSTFKLLADMTIPLIMLALGIYFTPKLIRPLPLFTAIFIRMAIGLAIGFAFVELFNFEGLTRKIILLASSAPIGFNTLTFSSLEDLDKDFSASLLSFSILIGIIYIPLMIAILA